MLLEVHDLTAGYSGLEIVHGISMKVDKGQIVAIIGPNGCGKSTLLNAIFGFIEPTSGSVIFNGEEVTELSPHNKVKKGMSYVFQRRSIFPTMSVQENLEMGGYTLKDSSLVDERVKFAFELFPNLELAKDRLAYKLSGGEQRMIEIARGLITKPQLLALDEPSIGLAPLLAKQIFQRIIELNETGISIVMVEQSVKRALEVCGHCYAINLGRLHFEGSGQEVLNNPELAKLYLPK
jgi:ABC-type branched-subunit amino acid transport system ATPase component